MFTTQSSSDENSRFGMGITPKSAFLTKITCNREAPPPELGGQKARRASSVRPLMDAFADGFLLANPMSENPTCSI
jgi:hypothetical protein